MMKDKKYRFGNLIYRVISPVALKTDERYEAFRTDESRGEDFRIEVLTAASDGHKSGTGIREGNHIKVYLDLNLLPRITIANLFSVAELAKCLISKNQFVLHASNIVYEGKSVLFSAPSGTGKSTQAMFWKEKKGAEIINEDRAIIYEENGQYYASGCWATGKAQTCKNVTVPIRAIVLLEQGPDNLLKPISPVQKFRKLIEQCTFDGKNEQDCQLMIQMILDLVERVPIVNYACINDISSVEALERHLL